MNPPALELSGQQFLHQPGQLPGRVLETTTFHAKTINSGTAGAGVEIKLPAIRGTGRSCR